jgi:hypothetical protein
MTAITLDTHGIDELMLRSPGIIEGALLVAGAESVDLLGPSILLHTHVISGDLRNSERVWQDGPTAVMFRSDLYYASFENDLHHFLDQGVDAVRGQVEATYDRVFDELAAAFGSGT